MRTCGLNGPKVPDISATSACLHARDRRQQQEISTRSGEEGKGDGGEGQEPGTEGRGRPARVPLAGLAAGKKATASSRKTALARPAPRAPRGTERSSGGARSRETTRPPTFSPEIGHDLDHLVLRDELQLVRGERRGISGAHAGIKLGGHGPRRWRERGWGGRPPAGHAVSSPRLRKARSGWGRAGEKAGRGMRGSLGRGALEEGGGRGVAARSTKAAEYLKMAAN